MRHRYFSLTLSYPIGGMQRVNITEETVKIYKPLGSVQCGVETYATGNDAERIANANIPVRAVACGNDGQPHFDMCGEPDGAINIFTIPKTKESKALSRGFKLLSELQGAQEKPCE